MSEMVEKVAQAIYDKPSSFDGDTVATHLCQSMMIDASSRDADEMLQIVRSVCEDAARAAIEAFNEPSDAFIHAVSEGMHDARFSKSGEDYPVARSFIRSFVDAALIGEGR